MLQAVLEQRPVEQAGEYVAEAAWWRSCCSRRLRSLMSAATLMATGGGVDDCPQPLQLPVPLALSGDLAGQAGQPGQDAFVEFGPERNGAFLP